MFDIGVSKDLLFYLVKKANIRCACQSVSVCIKKTNQQPNITAYWIYCFYCLCPGKSGTV